MEKRGKTSFADAIKGHARWDWKGPTLKTQVHTLPWMERNVVGQYNADLDFKQLGEEFVRGGMNMVIVRSMGDNLALLTPREGENMKELIKLNREWFDSIFVSIDPWKKSRVASHKAVWVRCYGLPISLWNEDCFARVVGEVTTLISIDKAALLWENLEFAQLQVKLEINCYVMVAKKMRINDHTLSISVEEELPFFTAGQCKGYHHNYDSSDNISSSETFVEESILSMKSDEEECNRRAGVELQSKGKEVRDGELEEGQAHKSKVLFEESSSRSRACQRKGVKPITYEETHR